jgi:cytochrome b involved in lipid metabolism
VVVVVVFCLLLFLIGGYCYDITDFVKNHPGGSEKILMAAGAPLEPFWHIYRQHFASDLPTRLLEHMLIGILDPSDQEKIDEQMDAIFETEKDPFEDEPMRHADLKVHGDQPLNAETPGRMMMMMMTMMMMIIEQNVYAMLPMCCLSHNVQHFPNFISLSF